MRQFIVLLSLCWLIPAATADPQQCPLDSATQIAQLVQTGKLSPNRCIQASKSQYESKCQKQACNMFILKQYDVAKPSAKGRLAGVPIAVKDIIDIKGLVTTAGTPSFKNNTALQNAAIVNQLTSAGATIVAKTNLDELSGGVTSMNLEYGYVENPHKRGYSAGGSSGGSAAAVAAGIVPVAIGTDTAGSTRIPAALTGVYGFKPTHDRYSLKGIVPVSPSLDTVGILASNISDIILVDSVLSQQKTEKLPKLKQPIRLGVPVDYFYTNLSPATKQAAKIYLNRLKKKGFKIVKMNVGAWIESYHKINTTLIMYEARPAMAFYLVNNKHEITMQEIVKQILSPGVKYTYTLIENSKISDDDYHKAKTVRESYIENYIEIFTNKNIDALIFPTTISPTLPFAALHDKDYTNYYTQNTIVANTAGAPALSIPIAKTDEGLPIGIEIDGLPGEDMKLLAIAKMMVGTTRNIEQKQP